MVLEGDPFWTETVADFDSGTSYTNVIKNFVMGYWKTNCTRHYFPINEVKMFVISVFYCLS